MWECITDILRYILFLFYFLWPPARMGCDIFQWVYSDTASTTVDDFISENNRGWSGAQIANIPSEQLSAKPSNNHRWTAKIYSPSVKTLACRCSLFWLSGIVLYLWKDVRMTERSYHPIWQWFRCFSPNQRGGQTTDRVPGEKRSSTTCVFRPTFHLQSNKWSSWTEGRVLPSQIYFMQRCVSTPEITSQSNL